MDSHTEDRISRISDPFRPTLSSLSFSSSMSANPDNLNLGRSAFPSASSSQVDGASPSLPLVARSATSAAASGRIVKYGGVNIAGFEFSTDTTGSRNINGAQDISVNGTLQMQHFVSDLGLNTFRLPVAWQYLVNNVIGGQIDPVGFGKYDKLVQGCLSAGADLCIVDV